MNTVKQYKISITGITPLIMHNDIGCNPLDPLTKQRKEISCIRKKTDEHYVMLARLEWEQALYYSEEIGMYLPSRCIMASIKNAAKKFKQGRDTKAITIIDALGSSLKGFEKMNPDKLWEIKNKNGSQKHTHCCSVVVQRARIMRTLPLFPEWKTTFNLLLDTEILNPENLSRILKTAGFEYGVGEMRPQLGWGFGKFNIESIEEVK